MILGMFSYIICKVTILPNIQRLRPPMLPLLRSILHKRNPFLHHHRPSCVRRQSLTYSSYSPKETIENNRTTSFRHDHSSNNSKNLHLYQQTTPYFGSRAQILSIEFISKILESLKFFLFYV